MVKFYVPMKNITTNHSKAKQAFLPLFISDFLDICDPVLVFDRFMEGIDLEKYLRSLDKTALKSFLQRSKI